MPAKSRTETPLLVAKLGGSLHAAPELPVWIAALKNWPHRLTLVCGGGPFADAVRSAQPKMGFSDATGHAMALLAMEQYALALAQRLHRRPPVHLLLCHLPPVHLQALPVGWQHSRQRPGQPATRYSTQSKCVFQTYGSLPSETGEIRIGRPGTAG